MDKEKLLKELHEKVNAWFEEKPQRPIAQFMLDTMLPYIEAVEHGVQPTVCPRCNNKGYYLIGSDEIRCLMCHPLRAISG